MAVVDLDGRSRTRMCRTPVRLAAGSDIVQVAGATRDLNIAPVMATISDGFGFPEMLGRGLAKGVVVWR